MYFGGGSAGVGFIHPSRPDGIILREVAGQWQYGSALILRQRLLRDVWHHLYNLRLHVIPGLGVERSGVLQV